MASDQSDERPKLSAVEVQQEYYEVVGDADWELYTKKDRPYLLQKVAIAMCGPPTKEGNLTQGDDLQLQGYEKRDESIIQRVFEKICEQEKYSHNNENILISIIRVVCVTPKDPVPFYKFTPSDYWVNLHSKKDVTMWIFHIFCIRKCISTKATKEKGCRVFIDHDGRVYHTWDQYLTENNLPECVIVVPQNGEYRGIVEKNDDDDSSEMMPVVKCSVVPSPALGFGVKVLAVTDTASTVANITALVGVGGSLFIPAIAPVAVPVAMGVGVVTGVYGIVRATMNLVDRNTHEQSIGLHNSEARGNWINILVSTAGISAMGASKLLSWAAANGTNVKILMNAVRILQYANLGSGALGVVNSLSDMIIKFTKYDEPPTALELFQFTTSALFFGIGVMTNQTAQDIVQDAQAKTINEIRESLPSNVRKRTFDKVTAETRRVQGTVSGNSDVIKALKNIENKNDFFAKLARMNKQMNKNQIRVSLAPDGKPLFNNFYKIEISELHGLGKSGRDVLFAKYGANTNTTPNAPTRIYGSPTSNGLAWVQDIKSYKITAKDLLKISTFLACLSKIDQEQVAEILSDMSALLHDAFLLLCVDVVEYIASYILPSELEFLKDPDFKLNVVIFVDNYIKSQISTDDIDKELSFTNILKEFCGKGRIEKETILRIKDAIIDHYYKLKKKNNYLDFDNMFEFKKKKSSQYRNLKAGEILPIGEHKILVKRYTVDKLEEWLEMYTQKKCDLFMNLCYKIISLLSTNDINKLIEVNFDEDIVMRVSHFIYFEQNKLFEELESVISEDDNFTKTSTELKKKLMKWRQLQFIRKSRTCEKCSGIYFL